MQNWTVAENMLLLDLYAQQRILLSGLENSDNDHGGIIPPGNDELWEECWISIALKMNQDGFDRSVFEVGNQWYNLIANGKEDFF